MLLVFEEVERMVNTQWTPDYPVMVRLKMMLTTCKLVCWGFGREKPSWSWTTRHNSWRNQHQRSDSWRHSGTQSGWLWESGLKIYRDSRPLHVKKSSRLVFRARALIQVFWSSSAGELILFENTFHFQGVDLGQLGQPGSLKLIGSGFPLFNLLCWEKSIRLYATVSVVVKM